MNFETTKEIEQAIAKYFNPRINMILPNASWGICGLAHECDILVLTPGGYAYEVEIKISKSDLKADLQKKHCHMSKLIRKLYFAIPKKMESCIDLIPEDAGVLLVYHTGDVLKKREAKVRTGAEVHTEKTRLKIGQLATLRMWNMKQRELDRKNIAKLSPRLVPDPAGDMHEDPPN